MKHAFSFLLIICFSSFLHSENRLSIIYDSGNTYDAKFIINKRTNISDSVNQSLLEYGFPLASSKWNIGKFELIPKGIPQLPIPFFLVGCNAPSRDWITKRKGALVNLNAIGYVVSCETRSDFSSLEKFSFPLKLSATNGNYFAEKLQHTTYPAIVTRVSIEQ